MLLDTEGCSFSWDAVVVTSWPFCWVELWFGAVKRSECGLVFSSVGRTAATCVETTVFTVGGPSLDPASNGPFLHVIPLASLYPISLLTVLSIRGEKKQNKYFKKEVRVWWPNAIYIMAYIHINFPWETGLYLEKCFIILPYNQTDKD